MNHSAYQIEIFQSEICIKSPLLRPTTLSFCNGLYSA